jgi:hypothetical protein
LVTRPNIGSAAQRILGHTDRVGSGEYDENNRPLSIPARSPLGREVRVLAVRRGFPLRDLIDGSGQLAGALLELGVRLGAWLLSLFRPGWTVGVVSVDAEPWGGQRVLFREVCKDGDPRPRLVELKRAIETGELSIPRRKNALLHRRPGTPS